MPDQKRRRDSCGEVDFPPHKIAKQVKNLTLNSIDDDENTEDMEGVEAKDFVHVSREDFNSALNEVEIDDRFMRIPKAITDASTQKYFERPSNALIPYDPQQDPCKKNGKEITT